MPVAPQGYFGSGAALRAVMCPMALNGSRKHESTKLARAEQIIAARFHASVSCLEKIAEAELRQLV
jgi:hypothetical protein